MLFYPFPEFLLRYRCKCCTWYNCNMHEYVAIWRIFFSIENFSMKWACGFHIGPLKQRNSPHYITTSCKKRKRVLKLNHTRSVVRIAFCSSRYDAYCVNLCHANTTIIIWQHWFTLQYISYNLQLCFVFYAYIIMSWWVQSTHSPIFYWVTSLA